MHGRRKIFPWYWLALALPACWPAPAASLPDDWQPVSAAQLDEARGGFELGNGLQVSLGVERLVSINGGVVASSRFGYADVTKLSAAEISTASMALAGIRVQDGGVLALPDNPGALLIQNSLNDQAIRSQTTISTTVSNLAMLKSLNFEGVLRAALSAAVGPK
ncbi:hypothetical protein ACFFKC_10235 [Pseudoduganella danionis]|uniref:hypothetical protein n=1 Tax=Pseudoduganella danionis TaxID=1890295 RepID=UPI001E28B03E|nr:hypothetical protein [Pseudoduganella danionis]